MYIENPAPRSRHGLGYNKRDNQNQKREDFLQSRRLEREIIGEEGISSVWGKSPARDADDESSASSDESEKTKKKHKKGSKKSKKKHSKKSKKKKSKKKKSKKKKESSSSSSSSDGSDGEEEEWVEKNADKKDEAVASKRKQSDEEDDEDVVGPINKNSSSLNQKDFGRALLPGEGAAMASYVLEGKRIPRRGEIGLTSDEIECKKYFFLFKI